MKHLLIGFIILVLVKVSYCQSNQIDKFKENIKSEAQIMANYLVKKDFDNFVKYMYPPIIKMAGGKDKILEVLKAGLSTGTELVGVEISNPSDTVVVNNEIQCTLEQMVELSVKGGKLKAKSSLIGISMDNGKKWFFIDASSPIEQMQLRYSNLSNRLVIPKSSLPVFFRDIK
jgi:hypothetical protein